MCGVGDSSAKSSYHFLYPTALELEHSKGTIPARSKAFLQIKVKLARRLHYTWSIKYAICTHRGEMDVLKCSEVGGSVCKRRG